MEISLWDDPDGFVEAYNTSPDMIRNDISRTPASAAVCARSSRRPP
jgi:hypothetical protein